ncbi:hypothetical protein SNE40_018574 [Patella caerulea]|uniref:Carboxylesterase type B domain-containing protein n=1 Tax=Patella caerulea TaxID=87958 RepID=A0AAN8P448_PATCE
MELKACISLVFYIIVSFQISFVVSISRTVSTSLGNIRGRLATHDEKDVYQFLGIPYAESPTESLRFKKPVTKTPWQKEFDATQYGPSCPQIFPYNAFAKLPNQIIDEDCLLLNIYVPASKPSNDAKAVMVFVHGGGFNSGQGMSRDGSLLAVAEDVIVVTINYRLDLLGFLYTGDGAFTGNYGIWDQVKALEWIQKHISSFEGDPNKVTLFGASAGAFSIGLHLVSTNSKGLFQRAILQSGSPVTHLALAFDPVKIARNVSITLGCTSDNDPGFDTNKFMQCLQNKNAMEIVNASALARTHNRTTYRLDIAPVIDGDFIKENPEVTLKKGKGDIPFYNCDIMTGTTTAEGGNLVYIMQGFYDVRRSIPKAVLCGDVVKYLVKDFYNSNDTITKKLCDEYSGSDLSTDEQSMNAVDFIGDMMFTAPAVRTLSYHAKNTMGKATYQYLFSHQPSVNTIKMNFPWFHGANHLDDIPFVFGPKLSYTPSTNVNSEEEDLSREMMTYWANFAKYGNPNGNDDAEIVWPEYTISEKAYLNINKDSTVARDIRSEKMDFWNKMLPPPTSTFTKPTSLGISVNSNGLLLTILCIYSVYPLIQ